MKNNGQGAVILSVFLITFAMSLMTVCPPPDLTCCSIASVCGGGLSLYRHFAVKQKTMAVSKVLPGAGGRDGAGAGGERGAEM